MPIRNPFAKHAPPPPSSSLQAENGTLSPLSRPSFERVDTVGSRASSILSVNSGRSTQPTEYEMSVVNDSGVYLPISPAETQSSWPRRHPSRTSLSTRTSESGEIDHFPISRESFDSYRRSFDISAKTPISPLELGRQSLDSARVARYPRSALHERKFERQPPTQEEAFEDVGLDDDQPKQPIKKRGFFSKFGDEKEQHATSSTASIFHMGRKRGHSGAGEELGNMQRPTMTGSVVDTKENR